MQKLIRYLLLAFLFLLPWQTRYIWHYGELNGGFWEYGTFSLYATEILLWLIIILFFWRQHYLVRETLSVSHLKKHRRAVLGAAIFFVVLAAQVFFSRSPAVSLNYVTHFLEGMALVAVLAGSGVSFVGSAAALWLGGVGQGALAIYQFLTQNVFASKWLGMAGHSARQLGAGVVEFGDQRWLRAYGSFGWPNSLGIYLAVLFVLGLVLYFHVKKLEHKALLSAGQLFIVAGLFFSFSRGAWLAVLAGVIVLGAVLLHQHRIHLYPLLKQLSVGLVFVVLLMAVFYPVALARFHSGNRLEVRSISERVGQYGDAMSFIGASSPLFGVGPGAYTYALHKKYPTLPAWQYQPIHNIYLLALAEWGVAGVIMLIFLFGYLGEKIMTKSLWLAPVLAAVAVAGIFDHWLISLYTGIIFLWVIIGLGLLYKNMLQLQQLGLPSGFRSSVQWLDNIYLTTIQYETKHPGRNHYAKNEHNR